MPAVDAREPWSPEIPSPRGPVPVFHVYALRPLTAEDACVGACYYKLPECLAGVPLTHLHVPLHLLCTLSYPCNAYAWNP